MAKQGSSENEPVKKRLVVCPECDSEVDLEQTEVCQKCDLNVERVYQKDRYDRALERLRKKREEESGKGKKNRSSDWNPFS